MCFSAALNDYHLTLSAIQQIEYEEPTESFRNRTIIYLWSGIEEGLELVKKISNASVKTLLFKYACQKYCERKLFAEAIQCAQNLADPTDTLAYIAASSQIVKESARRKKENPILFIR